MEDFDVLYRGQADSKWGLKTTLERFSNKSWSIEQYAELLLRCAPQLELYTKQSYNLPSKEELDKELTKNFNDIDVYIPFPWFYSRLRHHGFPSPLLDWTASPYIAACFAFAEQNNNADEASIYAYIANPIGVRGGWVGAPQITIINNVYENMTSSIKNRGVRQSKEGTCFQMP